MNECLRIERGERDIYPVVRSVLHWVTAVIADVVLLVGGTGCPLPAPPGSWVSR